MKNLDRTLKLLCPLCGNDQFGSLDVDMDELYDAPDNVKGNVQTVKIFLQRKYYLRKIRKPLRQLLTILKMSLLQS